MIFGKSERIVERMSILNLRPMLSCKHRYKLIGRGMACRARHLKNLMAIAAEKILWRRQLRRVLRILRFLLG